MKTRSDKTIMAVWVIMIMTCLLAITVRDAIAQPPPIEAPLVREGNFAMKLAPALNLGQPSSEAEAESVLGTVGIAPRNGWIADYPVTPDIMGELRDAVGYAAQARTISMDKDKALKALEGVQESVSAAMIPAAAGPPSQSQLAGTPQANEESAPAYPDAAAVGNYYSEEGPPIMTYYAPPPDYYYLYSWVPYPFWWGGFWFGGFFILNDFHRHHRDHDAHGTHEHFVSNHFNDVNAHRVFRIDPASRLSGRTFAGIGAPRANNFINTGVKGSQERIFNRDRTFGPHPGTGGVSSQPRTTQTSRQPSTGFRSAVNPFQQSRVYSQPPGGGRTFVPHAGMSRGRTLNVPSGGRSESAAPRGPSRGGGGRAGR